MTDDEIITALQDFRDEMAALKDSLGIDFPLVNAPQDNARGHRRGYGRFEDAPQYEITPEELPDGDNA